MIAANTDLATVLTTKINFEENEIVNSTSLRFKDSIVKAYQEIYMALWKDFIQEFNNYILDKYRYELAEEFIRKNLFLYLQSDGIWFGSLKNREMIFEGKFNTRLSYIQEAEGKVAEFNNIRLQLVKDLKVNVEKRIEAFADYSNSFNQIFNSAFSTDLFELYKNRLTDLTNQSIETSDFQLKVTAIDDRKTGFKLQVLFKDNYLENIYIENNLVNPYSKLEIYKNVYENILVKNILSAMNRIVKQVRSE